MSTQSNNNSNWSFPVRLLSSVAVVGRDNEPIYLRGSLSDSIFSSSAAATADEERAEWSGSDNEGDDNNNNEFGDESSAAAAAASEENTPSSKPGLFGRIKGAVIRKNDEGDGDGAQDKQDGGNSDTTDGIAEDDDDDDDDPFGFFGSSSTSSQVDIDTTSKGVVTAPMSSLTQQLVLHASLDRFEEKMASRPKNGGPARWRSPGAMGANAMWMGMLCEVEERLSLYGYITNTGIKFILLLEIIHMNEDGTRCHQDGSASSLYASSSSVSSLPSRETELKNMFAQVHDLYVRYNMNPFTKLRGPIKSHVFDKGIGEIARSFNSSAIEQASQNGEANGEGLAWM